MRVSKCPSWWIRVLASVLAALIPAAGLPAQTLTATAPVDIRAGQPVISSSGHPMVMLKVRSLLGEPLPLAAHMYFKGWVAYTSGGVRCNRLSADNLSLIDERGSVVNDKGSRAGVNGPALISVMLDCAGINRGDELSLTAILFVAQGGRWVQKNVTIDEQVIR